ncbi:MAG: threonine/serine dehydratase [Caldilinea sp.]
MDFPTIEAIRANRRRLGDLVRETPVWHWQGLDLDSIIGADTTVLLKLELFQHTGSFKPRGALTVMLDLDADELQRGVTAVSAGNHAIAVGFSARLLGTTAKVVMPKSANPFRVARCRAYGAEVELVDDMQQAFARVQQIQEEEGRIFVHPFEGPLTTLGTATVGLEFAIQAPDLDAVIIPIGGGGLCAGMACAFKQLQPACRVIGIEPVGADSMHRSLLAGTPQAIEQVRTIADSLGAPYALPYSFEMCRTFVDELVLIDDPAMQRAMGLLFNSMKLGVEPAGAAATAALCGPLRERLAGKRVGVIVCGANIDLATFAGQAEVK